MFLTSIHVAQQAFVAFVTWQHVDDVPKAGPAVEAAQTHVGCGEAGGGTYGHFLITMTRNVAPPRSSVLPVSF